MNQNRRTFFSSIAGVLGAIGLAGTAKAATKPVDDPDGLAFLTLDEIKELLKRGGQPEDNPIIIKGHFTCHMVEKLSTSYDAWQKRVGCRRPLLIVTGNCEVYDEFAWDAGETPEIFCTDRPLGKAQIEEIWKQLAKSGIGRTVLIPS